MKKILMLGEVELTGAEKDLLKQILGIEGELDIEEPSETETIRGSMPSVL